MKEDSSYYWPWRTSWCWEFRWIYNLTLLFNSSSVCLYSFTVKACFICSNVLGIPVGMYGSLILRCEYYAVCFCQVPSSPYLKMSYFTSKVPSSLYLKMSYFSSKDENSSKHKLEKKQYDVLQAWKKMIYIDHSWQRGSTPPPPILWRPCPPCIAYPCFFQILSTPSLPCCLQPHPPLLILLSCFFGWMGDHTTFDVLFYLMISWNNGCTHVEP